MQEFLKLALTCQEEDFENQMKILKEYFNITKVSNGFPKKDYDIENAKMYYFHAEPKLIKRHQGNGRKIKFSEEQIQEMKKMREDNISFQKIADKYNCSKSYVIHLLKK